MLPELVDLVKRYSPSLLWMDGDWEQHSDYWGSAKFLSWLYNESPVKDEVITNDRWVNVYLIVLILKGNECRGRNGGYWTPSDGYNPGRIIEHKWENCETISTSWGHNRREHLEQYKSAVHLLQTLFNVVSYGGNLLLNVSPTKDGLIPIIQEERLKEIGFFLEANGEAIYGTRPWKVQQREGNVWFTCKGDDVYVITTQWPDSGRITLSSVNSSHQKGQLTATLLATRQDVSTQISQESLSIDLPPLTQGLGKHNAWAFKISGLVV